jgi:hypothetical protein
MVLRFGAPPFWLVIPAALNSGAGQTGIQLLAFSSLLQFRLDEVLDSGFRRNDEQRREKEQGDVHNTIPTQPSP